MIPVLVVPDLREACEFYTTNLGFSLEWNYPDPPDYAGLTFGEATIHLTQNSGVTNTGQDVWLYMQVHDIDALYEFLQANGVEVEAQPKRITNNAGKVQSLIALILEAEHGRSMEEEAREILRIELAQEDEELRSLSSRIHQRFAEASGVDLRLAEREPVRQPPELGH